jgi:energy-coupling factor transport system substrate-specific component
MISGTLTAVTHGLGFAAFFYPFFLDSLDRQGESLSHAGDAPLLFSAFGMLLIALAVSEVRAGRMDAKQVALLGILSGVNAVLRLPGALAGASLMFVLPILCGYAYGARFGFMLGASSMAISGLITGGVGPWLPFQMWSLGWVGGGAGLLRVMLRGAGARTTVVTLAAYGWLTGLLYGALINLWFWPYLAGRSEISWVPGLSLHEGLIRYWRFYLLTSLAWDSARALVNAVLIVSLGRPILRLLLRFRDRLFVTWRPANATTLSE